MYFKIFSGNDCANFNTPLGNSSKSRLKEVLQQTDSSCSLKYFLAFRLDQKQNFKTTTALVEFLALSALS